MLDYEHTQPGTLIRVIIGVIILCIGVSALTTLGADGELRQFFFSLILPVLIALLILVLFHSLTVRVSRNDINLAFGIGLIQKSFLTTDVMESEIVHNPWYYGWGIKLIKGGLLYNVSGFDAVEIRLRNGRRYRIGTDEPNELLVAIRNATARDH